MKVTRPDRRDVIRSIVYISLYCLVIGLGAWRLLPGFWYLWLALVVVGLALLVNWHKEKTAYRCPVCGIVYTISFLTDLAAPHGFNRDGAWLLLRCPNCKQKRKTMVLKKGS